MKLKYNQVNIIQVPTYFIHYMNTVIWFVIKFDSTVDYHVDIGENEYYKRLLLVFSVSYFYFF